MSDVDWANDFRLAPLIIGQNDEEAEEVAEGALNELWHELLMYEPRDPSPFHMVLDFETLPMQRNESVETTISIVTDSVA